MGFGPPGWGLSVLTVEYCTVFGNKTRLNKIRRSKVGSPEDLDLAPVRWLLRYASFDLPEIGAAEDPARS